MTGPASIVMFVVLAVVACAALFYALFYDKLGKKNHATRRLETVRNSGSERAITRSERDRNADIQKRRKQLQDNIKDLEARQKQREKNQKYPPLRILMTQAGLNLTLQKFYLYSGASAFFATFIALLFGAPLLFLPGVAIAGFFGLPRWFVLQKRKQRLKKFLEEFPNALDVIVRATRAGLPLNDGLRLIASEAVEPVKSEFKKVVEAQQIGLSIPEAVGKMPDSMPCPETNFFAIVIR
jgi:tight adherence protein B